MLNGSNSNQMNIDRFMLIYKLICVFVYTTTHYQPKCDPNSTPEMLRLPPPPTENHCTIVLD